MSFYTIIEQYRDFDFQQFFAGVTPEQVEAALAADRLSEQDFLTLLSPAAIDFLEPMAKEGP